MLQRFFETLALDFDPNQPRDWKGRWTETGKESPVVKTGVAAPARVYHGSSKVFLPKDIYMGEHEFMMMDRMIGAHFASDPEIANTFSAPKWEESFAPAGGSQLEKGEVWYDKRTGEPLIRGGNIMPLKVDIKNAKVIDQKYYGERAKDNITKTDQLAIAGDIINETMTDNKEMFVKWARKLRAVSETEAGIMYDKLKAGESLSSKEYGVNKFDPNDPYYTDSFPPNFSNVAKFISNFDSQLMGLTMEEKHQLVKQYREILKSQGYDGIRYENTAPNEIKNAKDKTTWIAFDRKQVKSALSLALAHYFDELYLSFDETKHPRDNIGRFANKPKSFITAPGGEGVRTEMREPTEFTKQYVGSAGFKGFFRDSKVINNATGEPLEVYHGSLRALDRFDEEYTNPESFWGKGIYFSNTPDDASANYADITGPDKRNTFERIKENLQNFFENQGLERTDEEIEKEALEKVGESANIVPAYISIQNPIISGKEIHDGDPPQTMWDWSSEPVDPEDEDYNWEPTGKIQEFLDALKDSIDDFNSSSLVSTEADFEKVKNDLFEKFNYGDAHEKAHDVIKAAATSDGLAYADKYDENTDDSRLYASEIVRSALERMGYDGVIDRGVYERWGKESSYFGRGFQGMNEYTVHYTVWHGEQVKSSRGNVGTFRKDTKRLDLSNYFLQLAFDETKHPRDQAGKFAEKGNANITAPSSDPAVTEHNEKFEKMAYYVDRWANNAWEQGNITEQQSKDFAEDLKANLYLMNTKSLSRVMKNIDQINFYKDTDTITKVNYKLRGLPPPQPGDVVGGFFISTQIKEGPNISYEGSLHLDGDYSDNKYIQYPQMRKEVYAHELSHAIDGFHEYSDSKEWFNAWMDEIHTPGLMEQKFPLSRYATSNQHEGFAEFGRLVLTQARQARDEFPKMWKVWTDNGLT